jgi:hypothetical protein
MASRATAQRLAVERTEQQSVGLPTGTLAAYGVAVAAAPTVGVGGGDEVATTVGDRYGIRH